MKITDHFFCCCLMILLAGLPGCRKDAGPADTSTVPDTTVHVSRIAAFRGVYVDDFINILGREPAEDSLLNWCLKNNLNEISLYNAASAVATPAIASVLNHFVGRAKNFPYFIQVSAVATNSTISKNIYTRYYKPYPNKCSAITTEYEFWNSGQSYATFKNQLEYLRAIHDSTSGALKTQIYFSQFEDAAGVVTNEDTIARKMVSSSDKLFLVNYVADAYNLSITTLNKIKKIAQAAHDLDKPLEVVILFNVNNNSVDPSVYNYFSVKAGNHPFIDAYIKFKSGYDAVDFAHKSYVKLLGFQVYKYTNAASARPDL